MKHWTIWLTVWLLIAIAYFASRKTSPQKLTREISATSVPNGTAPTRVNKPSNISRIAQHVKELNLPSKLDRMPLTADQKAELARSTFTIAQTNPTAAIELTLKYQLDNGSGDVLPNLMQLWAQRDFDSALQWAVAQPPGDQRDRIFSHLAFAESQSAPREAADMILEQIPPGPAQQEAALTVLHQWLLQDFSAAKAWADQFPESDFKQRAQAELAAGTAHTPASQPASKH
jgi:hypothetical protein